nr:heat shock factor protein 3-like [Dasypus novemcinctus]
MEGAWNTAVPGFLSKLWALVDDSVSDDVIGWSENGQSFYIVNEQTFAKDLLPKYFKHNNISSFIRQLNMYGFRKVMALENGMTGQEKRVAMEFQHPFFRKGESNLLENIKRKVPTMKIEDVRIYSDEFQRMMVEVQEMREKQNKMDAKFSEMKKEYTTLWLEMTNLRQKHSEQQQLLAQMEILKNGYALIEDKNKCLIDNVLSTLKDESKDLVPTVDQASGADGKDHEILIQDIPMSGDSVAIDLDLVMPDFQELMAEESFAQETNVVSSELASPFQDNNLVLNEDKSNTQYNTIMNRDEIHCIEANLVELKALLSRKKVNYDPDCVSEVPISNFGERLQDSNDLLLDDLRDPSNVLPDLCDHDYIALNVSSPPEDVANPIEIFEPQLSEETSGECKLFPLLFLNPVANFIEESTNIEPST